jgi:hypothetical protein
MDESRAVKLLGEAFRCQPIEGEEEYTFSPKVWRDERDFTVSISKNDLNATVAALNKKTQTDSLWLCDSTTMEMLVREETSRPMRRLRDDQISLRDDDNGVSYKITSASDEYILFYLDKIIEHPDAKFFLRGYARLDRYLSECEATPTIFDLMRIAYLRIRVVQVVCDSRKSSSDMLSLAHAFLFQMAFNADIALVPQKEIDSIFRSGGLSRIRRNYSDMDPPRKIYDTDLIHHYLMAISTDNPFVEYLSHYHVLEHFYEEVFQDELISSIQNKITSPDFSYRRKKDISGLIKMMRKSLRIQNDTITFSEEQALKLTLMRFVVISDLVDDLKKHNASILEYYQYESVSFANAPGINWECGDNDAIYKALSRRIYTTRNALVHSKNNDKLKYTPFVHDHILAKELPLLRLIAEKTILFNSKMIV